MNIANIVILFIRRHLKLIIITLTLVIAVGLLTPFLLSFTPENMKKNEIKELVAEKIARDDFVVKEVLAEVEGWTLAKISIETDGSENTSLVILKEEKGRLVLKLGPGTSFSAELLEKTGVPWALYSPEQSIAYDPIVKLLPYDTDNFSLKITPLESKRGSGDGNSKNKDKQAVVGTPDNKKTLTVYMYEFPRTGVKVTPQRIEQARKTIASWMQSNGLNPDNYSLTFAVWPYGNY